MFPHMIDAMCEYFHSIHRFTILRNTLCFSVNSLEKKLASKFTTCISQCVKRHPHDKEFLVTHATSGYKFVLTKIDILLEGNMTPKSNLMLQMHLIYIIIWLNIIWILKC